MQIATQQQVNLEGLFQVSWYDLNYGVSPNRRNISGAWQELKVILEDSFKDSYFGRLAARLKRSSGSYDINKQQHRDANEDTIKILRHVNGSFRSGQLVGVMGPSGAGKTSLMNILARWCETGFTGQIWLDSAEQKELSIIAVPQHDKLPEYLTVRENLMFASKLKNPPESDHEKNVHRVSELLGLGNCLDTRVALISGGQQKRLTIAQELLSRPDILILDEPTSGLDSSTCIKTLTVLKNLVEASVKRIIDPIAIVLTIHQPQLEAFNLFDKVYVMASGGLTIYDGPPSKCADFVLKHTGISMPTPDYNPASFMIDIASGEYGQEPIEQLERQVRVEFEKNQSKQIKSLEKAFELDRFGSKNTLTSWNSTQSCHFDNRLVQGSTKAASSEGFIRKVRILTIRRWYAYIRNPLLLLARLAFYMSLPLLMAVMFGKLPGESNACPEYRQNYTLKGLMTGDGYVKPSLTEDILLSLENLCIFFLLANATLLCNISIATIVFALDLRISLREYYNGWYSLNAYLLSNILSNLPYETILPVATVTAVYYATGQRTGDSDLSDIYRIAIMSSALVIGTIVVGMIALIIGTIYMNHITTAVFVSQCLTIPFMLLSGFARRIRYMNLPLRILADATSLTKHVLDISFMARYSWNVCPCDPREFESTSPKIVDTPERLNDFLKYWQASAQGDNENSTNQDNMMDIVAKQISLYNTFGVDLKSCDSVVPYMLMDYGLEHTNIIHSYLKLIGILLFTVIMMLFIIKVVIKNRSSI